jgi:hypothetical protein
MPTDIPSTKLMAAFSAVLFIFSSILRLPAQDTPPVADKAPVPRLSPAPAMSAWTIQYQYRQADPYPKTGNAVDDAIHDKMRRAYPRLETVEVVKTDNRRKEVYHYVDGTETTQWIIGDYVSDDMRLSHLTPTGNALETDVDLRKDFYDLDWINKAAYQGHQDYQGVDCYVFKGIAADVTPGLIAYINARTRLPQAIQASDGVRIYTFRVSTDNLEVPDEVSQRVKAFQASLVKKT